MRIINVTPHAVTFQSRHYFSGSEGNSPCIHCGAWRDEGQDVECRIYSVDPCGTVINARPVEEPAGVHPSGAELVKTSFVASPEAEEALSRLEQEVPDAIIVGSIIAAQTFPGRVLAMVPFPGFERVPPAEKRTSLQRSIKRRVGV